MRVLGWNVQGAVPPFGSKERIRNQEDFVREEAGLPDVLLLDVVRTVQRELWRELLTEVGYTQIGDTLNWAAELRESDVPHHQDYGHVNGNLTAVHNDLEGAELTGKSPSIRYGPWEKSDLKDRDTNVPEKILNAELQLGEWTIDLWNVRAVPGSMHGEEKIKILENTYNRIRKGGHSPCILAADFNSPDRELPDGTLVPWRADQESEMAARWVEAERNILTGLSNIGMVDVFRDLNGW